MSRSHGAKHSPPAGRPSGGPHGNLATLAQESHNLTHLDDMSLVMVILNHDKRAWKIRINTMESFECDHGPIS